ncbi:hypothetical protein ACEPPN_012509 [Leptodophora sp. 'Broadleaf-Isolate-01']
MATSATSSPDAIIANPTSPNSESNPATKSEPFAEKQDSIEKHGPSNLSREDLEDAEPGLEDNTKVPSMSLPSLFWFFFYNFGIFAWGGPVAQIALIKERLVIQDKWITIARFQRVFSVYQILPGPEAAELCMFFRCLSAGRIGGIIAGIAFILPGFILMLLASYLYSLAGFETVYFNASFKALQPIVAAMILKAVHRIADHSLINPKTKKVDVFLVIAALCTAVNSALRINMQVPI